MDAITMTPSSSKVALLESTLTDLHIRSAVEETMQSMLIDVELADTLSRQVSHQNTVSRLKSDLEHSCTAMQEQRALQAEEEKRRVELADELVKELWTLSITLGDLEEWKREAMPMVEEHDSLLAQLAQAEEELSVLREKQQKEPMESAGQTAAASTQPPEEEVSTPNGNDVDPIIADTTITTTSVEEIIFETPSTLVPETQNDTTDAVVALLEDEEPLNFAELDMKILNHIFAYLDAFEILRTAQCNISLYSRVDSLFGLGSSDASSKEVTEVQQQSRSSSQAQNAASSTAATATIVSVPPPSSSVTTAPPQLTNATPQRLLGTGGRQGGVGLFSMLQNRTAQPAATAAATAALQEQPALNRSAVNSMADKLTPMELTAIISMTEKLNSREKEVKRMMDEKEELAGKLEGTERFKEFLSQRVLDLETSLRRSEEDQSKVALQIASDQEVIAFLDGRVQELERNERVITEEKKKLVQELDKIKKQNSQKVRVMGDMLQFERERLAENEKDWKATKKLLVKEVKNCRAQIMAAQAERDGYREQNERLKKAVLVNGGSRERMELL